MDAETLKRMREALQPYKHRLLRDVYDAEGFPQWACSELIAGFEYPEWDYRTIAELLKESEARHGQ